jgi:uncharacterized hydrophobic protein (TIGR00271 family)
MKMLLIVVHAKMAAQAVPWLAESARKQGAELLVTNCALNPLAVPGRVSAWPLIEKPENVRGAVKEAVESLADDGITLLDEINGTYPDQEVTELIKKLDVDIVYLPVNAKQNPGAPEMQFAQKLLRDVPCNVILIDLGDTRREYVKRIIVPMDLAASGHVIRHIIKIGANIGVVVPLHISPDFGVDSEKIAASELDLQLKEVGIEEDCSWISPEVVMADSFDQGLLHTIQKNDAVILGGSSVKLIHDLRMQLISIRSQIADAVPVAVYRPSGLAAKTKIGRFARRLKAALPDLTLADRVSLFDRIQGGSRVTTDFIIMIGLSVLIASFGLLADNASVVIGAMLVAPFMTPLIGVGLALAQGNLALMKRSALATVTGVLVGVVLSFILGICVPLDELPLEILARGDPDIVDLAIAFVSGMAAAYAVSRESVAESIVGVAIAAALVPPLSCIGIMFANGYILETEGAITLLITNLAAIAVGAAVVFRRLGVPGTRTGHKSYVKIRWISTALILLLFALAIPLVLNLAKQLAVGQTRPMSFRVSTQVKRAVNDRIDQIDGLEIMFLGRSGSGHSRLIRILLDSDGPIPASMIKKIKADLREDLGENTPVHIGVFQNAIEKDF